MLIAIAWSVITLRCIDISSHMLLHGSNCRLTVVWNNEPVLLRQANE